MQRLLETKPKFKKMEPQVSAGCSLQLLLPQGGMFATRTLISVLSGALNVHRLWHPCVWWDLHLRVRSKKPPVSTFCGSSCACVAFPRGCGMWVCGAVFLLHKKGIYSLGFFRSLLSDWALLLVKKRDAGGLTMQLNSMGKKWSWSINKSVLLGRGEVAEILVNNWKASLQKELW